MVPSPKRTGLIVLLLFSFVSQGLGAVVEITLTDTIKLYPLKSDPECVTMKCPKPGSEQWRALNERCCTEGRYHCQENDVGGMIVIGVHVTCMKPVRCAAGTFFDLRNVILNMKALDTVCRICPPGEFQPKATLSHHLTRSGCKIRKGCFTLNAILVKTGTSTTDDMCKCNYLNGYRPVSLADNKCLTFESLSGCRCTHEPCPEGKFMSPKDYRCLNPTAFTADSMTQLSIFRETLEGRLEQNEEFLSEQDAVHNFMATLPVYVCPDHCDNDKIQGPPPSLWVSLTDFDLNGVMTALTMPGSKPWPILLLCLFTLVFCFALFAKKLLRIIKGDTDIKRRETMVHFKLQSKKTVVAIYKELENILPMLARHYGHLNMAANYDTRVISVLVDPSKCKHSFQILHFIRDLLSPESIKKQLTANGTRQDQAVEVTVSYPKCPRKHASDNVRLAAPKLGHLKNNSGELILRFDSSVGNERVLSELNARKDEIKEVLKGFKLDLTSIKKGSVVIKFHLQHGSKTFDTLTLDGEIEKLADQLLSNESFGRFRRETPATLSIQFIVKGNLQHVTAVYADNLNVQMGERNNVYTCEHAHIPLETNESADGPVQRTEATDRQECVAKFVKINLLTLSPLPEQPASSAPKKSSDPVRIEVDSQDGNVIKLLREEWSNVKSLLEKQYPGCHMKSKKRKIIWELPVRDWKDSDVKSFVGDIFAIKRINNAIRTKPVCVDIHIPEWLAEKSVTRRLVKMLSKLWLLFKINNVMVNAMMSASVQPLCFVFCTRSRIVCSCTVVLCASVYLATVYPR